MVKVVETNLSMKDGKIYDHQSRMVKAESWEEYIDYYKRNIKSDREHSKFKTLTGMFGDSLPRYGNLSELKYDDFHLSCYHTSPYGMTTMKLAYCIYEDKNEYIEKLKKIGIMGKWKGVPAVSIPDLIKWLSGEKYANVDETSDNMTEEFEREHQWELSRNCFINKTIKHLEEFK